MGSPIPIIEQTYQAPTHWDRWCLRDPSSELVFPNDIIMRTIQASCMCSQGLAMVREIDPNSQFWGLPSRQISPFQSAFSQSL